LINLFSQLIKSYQRAAYFSDAQQSFSHVMKLIMLIS
jgi:hypothetical protein